MNQVETVTLTDEEAALLRWARDEAQDGDEITPGFSSLFARGLCHRGQRSEYGYLTPLGVASLHVHEQNAKLAHEREGLSMLAKRGWVSACGRGAKQGEWIRNTKCISDGKPKPVAPHPIARTYGPCFFNADVEVWTGCPRCSREEPHDIDTCGAAMPIVPFPMAEAMPGPCRYCGNSTCSGGCRRELGMPKINPPRARGIVSQDHLAKSLFVAQLWEELERRAERTTLPPGPGGVVCGTYKRDPREIATIMWNDPTYAKARATCEEAAERVWAARKVFR